MKRNNIHIGKAVIFFFTLIITINAYSQQDLIINTMPIIPQSNNTNPAFLPTPKAYIGFPLLSSIYIGVGNSGFAYKDLFHYSPIDDSLHLTMANMVNKLGKANYLSMHLSGEIFCFGVRLGKRQKGFFSFSMNDKVDFQFEYPRDLMKLLWQGNGQFVGSTADFSKIGINAAYYREFAIGLSREFGKHFTFGVKVKILNGMANIYTKTNAVSVGINQDDFGHTANDNFTINTTLPNYNFNHHSKSDPGFDYSQFLTNGTNKGKALDFGASYKNDHWMLGASLLDLGYIDWQSGGGNICKNYSSNVNNFVFDGLDLGQLINQGDSKQKWQNMLDSLKNTFKVNTTNNNYRSPLDTKFYITAIYSLTQHSKVGLLFHGEMLNSVIHPTETVSFNQWVGKMLSVSLSYSVMNSSYSNVGFGMALNLGFWQMYVTTDNFYCLFAPEGARNADVHLGINLIFDYKPKKPNLSLFGS